MSSVSASASEYSELFGHDEETGEVQPAAVAEQVCTYVDGQPTTPSTDTPSENIRPWYVEKLHEETGTSRKYCERRLADLYRDGFVEDDKNGMCIVTKKGATALGVTNVPPADIPLNSFFTNNPKDTANKFGHNRFNIRTDIKYPIEKGKGKQPSLNHEAAKRVRDWMKNPDKYPELTTAMSVNDFWIRSDFIEKIGLMLQAIFRRMNNPTMIVGIPNKTGMRCWSVEKLAELAGIPKRGAEYVLTRLYKCKLMTSAKQMKEITKGVEYEYYPSVRVVSEKLFEMLDFTKDRIKAARGHGSETLKKTAEEQGVTSADMVRIKHKMPDKPKQERAAKTPEQPEKDMPLWMACLGRAKQFAIQKGWHLEYDKIRVLDKAMDYYTAEQGA